MADENSLAGRVTVLAEHLLERQLSIVTVESCTGGLLSAMLTDIPGSSKWFDRGFVSYSNRSKVEMVGVKQSTLDKFGAVSEEVALEMALGGGGLQPMQILRSQLLGWQVQREEQ